MASIPTDGRMTSFFGVPAPLAGDELLWIVQPGNAAAGVLYNVTTTVLAKYCANFPLLNTIEILTGATSLNPFSVPTTATRVLLNKTVTSASFLVMPLAASMALQYPVLIKDFQGAAFANNITISFTGGELCDGQSSLLIDNNYGWVTLNPAPGGGSWYQG